MCQECMDRYPGTGDLKITWGIRVKTDVKGTGDFHDDIEAIEGYMEFIGDFAEKEEAQRAVDEFNAAMTRAGVDTVKHSVMQVWGW